MKFNIRRVSLLFIVFVVICESKSGFKIRIDEEITCAAHSTCSQCNTDIACGWCLDTPGGSCTNATEHGQPVDFCDLWFYGTCSFEDSCEDLLTCDDCLASKHCGFCDTICLIGNAKGPTSNATCGQWVFEDSAQCTALNCSLQTDCVACFDIPGCAWCEDNDGHCRSHSDPAPTTSTTGQSHLPICKHWSSASCPNDRLDCSKHPDCSTCIEDLSGACSWCSTTSTCVRDGSTEADTCANFKQKTCDDACLDFSENCTDCVRNPNCLWCDDSCVMGDSTGPSYANCANWLYGQCTTPVNCSQYTNCGTCTTSGCNWCESSSFNQCLPPDSQCAGALYTNCSVVPLRCTAIRCDECLTDPGCVWCSNGCSLASLSGGTSCEMSCTQPDHGSVPGGIHEGAIIGITVGGVAVMGGIGMFVWHRLYWTKRHYYEKLG